MSHAFCKVNNYIYVSQSKFIPKLTIGELRMMTVKALAKAWEKMLTNPNVMIRAFQRTGTSLRPDGSQDQEIIKFQS